MDQQQEDFDQKRFLTAMVLSGIVLIVWQVFFAPPPPEPPVEGETATTAAQIATDPQLGQQADQQAVQPTEDAPAVKLEEGEAPAAEEELPVLTHELRTKDFRVMLSSRGARVVEAETLEPEQYNRAGDLLAEFPEDSDYFPYGITFTKNSIALRRGLVWQFVPELSEKAGEAYSKVTYRHSDPGGRFEIDKVFTVDDEARYQLDFDVVVRNKLKSGAIVDSLALDITGYKDPEKESSFLDVRPDEVEGICKLEGDIEREFFSSVENPLAFSETPTQWGAIDTRYFLFAAVPAVMGTKCVLEPIENMYLRTRIVQPEFVIQPGQEHLVEYDVFIGPKDYDVLEATGAKLEESVDYGILTFIARPLRWLLVLFFGWVGNWGLAIIVLTLLIRLLTWPINQKVYKNSEKMKELQPALNEIKEKFKDDQQRLAEETMKVWKEHGVSPLGCLPMFLQFPILLALYFMILNSVELYQANFAFWYTDLSAPDPYFILPVLMGLVMFVQQSFMTIDTPNPQMATMMKIMPVMFTVFMLFLPSGVVLYYFVSLVLGLVQQYWIKRSFRAKSAAPA